MFSFRNQLVIGLVASAFSSAVAGPYAPAVGQTGSDAISASDASIQLWASAVVEVSRGPADIRNPGGALASFGTNGNILGPADATPDNPYPVLSLGDGGHATVSFSESITNGPGPDLVVFENSVDGKFLELAFVEVSSDGVNFFRFPSVSLTQTATQVGSFGSLDPTNIYNLAGKYQAGWGTPFDLADLVGVSPLLDVNHISEVRVTDVVGSINDAYASYDSMGNKINDPWPTNFASGGFDLDAIGAINVVPEPSSSVLLALGGGIAAAIWRRSSRSAQCRVSA